MKELGEGHFGKVLLMKAHVRSLLCYYDDDYEFSRASSRPRVHCLHSYTILNQLMLKCAKYHSLLHNANPRVLSIFFCRRLLVSMEKFLLLSRLCPQTSRKL